ncbi:MAG: cation-translocating P-type ATPase [Rhizobacter sp.]
MPAPETIHADAVPASGGRLLDDRLEQGAFTTWRISPQGESEAVSQFRISGMYCAACAGQIEDALRQTTGVVAVRVQAASERAEVVWTPEVTRPSALIAAIQAAGYGAAPDVAASDRAARTTQSRAALWRLFLAGFCMMQVMMYAAPAYFAAPGDIDADSLRLLQWASWLLSVPVMLFSAQPFFRGLLHSLRTGRLGMDVPVALGLIVTFVASTGATFDPGGLFGHEVYFDSLTMFVFFLLGGRWLELRARHRVASQLETLLCHLPEAVERVLTDGRSEWVSPRQLQCGDILRVARGQRYAVDGQLFQGSTQVDEALLTGESLPQPKKTGDEVVAGSVNLGDPVMMRVSRLGADTRLAGIQALVRSALTQKPEAVAWADRWAAPFLWVVLALAAAAGAVWAVVDPSRSVAVMVAVLIVTCPCALSLAAPSALLAATTALAQRGVLLRRLGALQALASVDLLFVDKTGTLTDDRLALKAVHPVNLAAPAPASASWASQQLERAASLAVWSNHPMSRALVHALPDHRTQWNSVQEVAGSGLQAVDSEGQLWRLGSRAWVAAQEIHDSGAPDQGQSDDRLNLWFGRQGRPEVCFELEEQLRPDTERAVQLLQQDGVQVLLLSGDTDKRVQAMAQRLGLQGAFGSVTPEGKLAIVASAQAKGYQVAMVGDGLNDAPVLAQADVSFAFSHGAAVSQLSADAVLLSQQLTDVWVARRLAQRCKRVVRQNLTWAAFYNAACVPLALLGYLPPWAAGLGMASSSLLVVLNALRLSKLTAEESGNVRAEKAKPALPQQPAMLATS